MCVHVCVRARVCALFLLCESEHVKTFCALSKDTFIQDPLHPYTHFDVTKEKCVNQTHLMLNAQRSSATLTMSRFNSPTWKKSASKCTPLTPFKQAYCCQMEQSPQSTTVTLGSSQSDQSECILGSNLFEQHSNFYF